MARQRQRSRHGLTLNAADPRAVDLAEELEARRLSQMTAALEAVLATPEGRFVIGHWIRRGRIYESIFDPSSRLAFLEGMRTFALSIRADCEAANEGLLDEVERDLRRWETLAQRELEAEAQSRAVRRREEGNDDVG